MSYDIHLEMTVDIGNYTSNVAPMWTKALGYRLADLHTKTADDALDDLRRAVQHMQDHPDVYRALEPSNGWGSYDGALDYLRRLLDACTTHPEAMIRISH